MRGQAPADPSRRRRGRGPGGRRPQHRDEDDVGSVEHRQLHGLRRDVLQLPHDRERELAEHARLRHRLTEFEQTNAEMEQLTVAVEESLGHEVGGDP